MIEKYSLGAVRVATVEELGPLDDHSLVKFLLDPQDRVNWCWAAVSVSVARHQKSPKVLNQCRVVELALPCDDCKNSICNYPGDVVVALGKQSISAQLQGKEVPDFQEVLGQIKLDRPVVCRVPKRPDDPDSLPHFVVIERLNSKTRIIKVRDPAKRDKTYNKRWEFDVFSSLCLGHFFLA